jgi:hypothetical protein
MKRLIVSFDGTWNSPEQEDNGIPAPTNVFKLHNAIADNASNGSAQLKYYHPGLGSKDDKEGSSVLGGTFGAGISRHICSAYHWLASTYEDGDEIFLFGFSRGAFTVRSLGGLLGGGLLDLRTLAVTKPAEAWNQTHKIFEWYRRRKKNDEELAANWATEKGLDWVFFHQGAANPVRFLGVWDTVGALGIPDDLEILNLFDDKDKWQFHDTSLGDHVKTARHAMAIDEIRSSFTVTRWDNAATHADAREIWFPGCHSNVGGGYANCDLSDGALLWMMEEAEKAGLNLRPETKNLLKPNPLGVMHNSYKGMFSKLRSRPRNVPAMIPEQASQFHPSALERQTVSPVAYPAYHPTRILKVGETSTVDVFADTRWNATGIYLPAGHAFTFSSAGEWLDSKDVCDWKGTEDGKPTVGDALRLPLTFLGKSEWLVPKSRLVDIYGTKRVEKFPWFIMVGAIANDGTGSVDVVKNDGSPVPHQYVKLPAYETSPLVVGRPGYLYCFPNDAWAFYHNNHGSVRLTVKRVR